MALSVKKFTHVLDCPEPDNQINVTYHPTSSDELCAGNGTPTAIFSYSNGDLAGVVAGDESANGANTDVCAEGMDVIFLVDYTGSMSRAIGGVKTGISSLVNTIISESGGNYRLGLVLYDEQTASSPRYAASGYYQALPADQKINEPSPDDSYYLFTTCVEKMTNIGNQTTFTSALNAIDSSTNSNAGMVLGAGGDGDEPAGRALYEIAAESFAGSFRSGVQKLVILITDNITSESDAYWQNTLTPALNNAGIQLMVQVDDRGDTSVTPTSMAGSYTYATENTQPQGFYDYTIDFRTAWTSGLELAISNLCQETFTYNCESIAIGWYMEDGTNTAQYWNGSTWSEEVICEKTVVINLLDGDITDGGINSIENTHPYYTNSHKYTITAPIGTLFSLPNSCYADLGYSVNDITQVTTQVVSGSGGTISVATDNGVATSTTNSSLANNEFVISGEVTHDMEFNVNIRANTAPETYAIKLTVIGKVDPSITPTGVIQPTGTTPSGWSTNFATTERTFVAEYGDTITWSADIAPTPSDYTYNVTGSSVSYSTTGIEFAFRNTYTLTKTSIGGTFEVPIDGGDVTITLQGTIEKPEFTFDLSATEAIRGASISETSGIGAIETYSGYTGDTFDFEIKMVPDAGYHPPFNLAAGVFSPPSSNPLAISSPLSINEETDTISGTLTMPKGGGDATVSITGNSNQIQYTYTIDFVDPYNDTAYWKRITYTGAAGSFHATTHPLLSKQADTSYTITSVTNDDSTNLISTDDNTVDRELNIVLASMPLGGGSATVTIEGSNSAVTYDYTVHFDIPASRSNWFWSSGPELRRSVTVSGAAGSKIEVNADQMIKSATDYTLANITVTESSLNTSLSGWTEHSGLDGNSRTQVYGFTPKVTVTMPSGGGNSIVDCSAIANQLIYTFTVNAVTDSSTSYVGQDTCTGGPGTGASTGSYGGAGSYIQFTGTTDQTWQAEFPAIANNVTDYRSEINSWSFSPNIAAYLPATEGNSYCAAGYDFVNGDFTMPSLDARSGLGYDESILTIDDTVSGKTHAFTLTSNSSIFNVSANQKTQLFTGIVGSTHNWQTTYSATEGYAFNITSVNESGSNIGAVSVTDNTGTNIGGQIIMPSGGGSATVTAGGTSNEIKYAFTVVFSETVSNAAFASNGQSTVTRSVQLAPGETTTLYETIQPTSGYDIVSLGVTDNSSIVTSFANSSTGLITATDVTMPADATGNQWATLSVTGSTKVSTRTLQINYSDFNPDTYVSSGSGAGAGSLTRDFISGTVGSTFTFTRYFLPEPGYGSASIKTLFENSDYVYDLRTGSSAGAGQAFHFSADIPPTDQTATITINGSATYDCSACSERLLAYASQTANSEGGTRDGVIRVSAHDGCIPEYSWTLNDTPTTPVLVGPLTFEFRGLTVGEYTIQLTDSNGCLASQTVTVGLNATTTQAPAYSYYNATICPDGIEPVILRGTRAWAIGSQVTLVGTSLIACIDSSRPASVSDYDIQGATLGDGSCNCGGGKGDDPFIKDGPSPGGGPGFEEYDPNTEQPEPN